MSGDERDRVSFLIGDDARLPSDERRGIEIRLRSMGGVGSSEFLGRKKLALLDGRDGCDGSAIGVASHSSLSHRSFGGWASPIRYHNRQNPASLYWKSYSNP